MIIRSFASGGRVVRRRTCALLSVAIQSLAVVACIPYPLPVDYFHRNFRLRAFRLGWSLRRRPHRRGHPVDEHSSSFEKQAPPAKSLNPARPVGTVTEGSGGEAVRGRGYGGTHRGAEAEGRDPSKAHRPHDPQRAERPSRGLDERLRHRDSLVLSCPPRRPEESHVARSRSIRPEQGPRVPGVVRRPRGARLLPGRGAHDVPEAQQPLAGPSGVRDDAGRGERRGGGRSGPLLLRRPGPRGKDGSQGLADVLRARRRRAGRGPDVGGLDVSAGPWKMESQRSYFGRALVDLGRRNPNVVVVGADTTESLKSIDFGKAFPDRFFQLGIAEPNMISVAAGLAAAGKIPFATTYSVFGSAHTYNVIRQNVAYTNLNVKIFCSHAGLTVGPDGATHQINEDIGLMRGIPRMTVLVPADGPETARAAEAAAGMKGPIYCRFSRTNVPTVTSDQDGFAIGKARTLRDGSDVTLIGCGLMVARCLEAAQALERDRVSARVINLSTVKPLDLPMIDRAARETGRTVTAEEHTVVHGIGAAVAAAIAVNHPVPVAVVW